MHDQSREIWQRCPFDCDQCDDKAALEGIYESICEEEK